MNYVFTAAGCHQGQPHRGVSYGYTAALSRMSKMSNTNDNVTFIDFRHDKPFEDPIYGSYLIGQKIGKTIEKNSLDDPICLTIGGDHTISFGTVISSLRRDPDTKLIWIDAHSDINSPETSLSGNCHGMPVSYILGLSTHKGIPDIPHLKPHNLVYIGLRSVDPAEELILSGLESEGMLRFDASYIKEESIGMILWIIEDHFGKSPNIHISLDIDSIDPTYAPATGTPVPNGLSPSDVIEIIRWANEYTTKKKVDLDITEINPELSDLEGACNTYGVVDQILDAYFA